MLAEEAENQMSPAIAVLATAIDIFCARECARSPEAVGWELTHLRHQCDRLELEFSMSAATFAATDEYDAQGFVSPIQWIRHKCNMGGGAAADRIAVGELAQSLPRSNPGDSGRRDWFRPSGSHRSHRRGRGECRIDTTG